MLNDFRYLRQNVQVEPLVDRWYAWAHLIPPATAARNIAERHLRIMDSYISAPLVHANAVKNPKMLGGPFIDYGGKRVDEIRALRDDTKKKRARLLAFSAALTELDGMLREQAKGHSLQKLYEKVPPLLRGYVELVYDLNNQPSFRLIEPLLYKSDYYDRSAQSAALSLTSVDDRPFVLSTPRLKDEGTVEVDWPFNSPAYDDLFRLKTEPRPWSAIRDGFDVAESNLPAFEHLFAATPGRLYEPYTGDKARWRYFGHACVLVETRNTCILFDPVLSYTHDGGISRYTYEDLPPRIDAVIITHNHQDHILFETLMQLRHKVQTVIVPRSGGGSMQDPSVKLLLQACGFQHVIELGECETVRTDGVEITGLPFLGEHADLDVRSKLAYHIRLGEHTLLFVADSCNIEPALYEHIHRLIGDCEVLFVGMECDGAPLSWLYGPLLTKQIERSMDESRRLAGSNHAQAIDMVNRFHCREVYVYAMGQEPWLNYVMSLKYTDESRPIVESNALLKECRERGILAERLFGEKEMFLS